MHTPIIKIILSFSIFSPLKHLRENNENDIEMDLRKLMHD
jgi:hypothetical protein